VDGIYEAWISVPVHMFDHDDELYISCGRFNVNPSTGGIIDTNGNPVSLTLKFKPANINDAEDALITIEPPFDTDTLPGIRLLGGTVTNSAEFLTANLSMTYDHILGTIAEGFPAATAGYILNTPTSDTTAYNKGLWFTADTNGTSTSLTVMSIPDTLDWTYQAWVFEVDRADHEHIYNMGRFSNPSLADDNQQCQGNPPSFVYNKPGHDWIQPNCPGGGLPDILNLNTGTYRVVITLEPRTELAVTNPFFIRLFEGVISVAGPGTVGNVQNVTALPTATIKIAK
jgi:hypothetical protein